MYCSNCNKTFPQGTVFCDSCGGRLDAENTPAQNAAPPYQGPTYHNPQSFTPPPYPMSPQATSNNQMTTGKWIGIFLINIIPLIGPLIYLIMLFKWAFGACKYPSLKSFAKAMLILMLIAIIISILVAVFLAPMMADLFEQLSGGDFSEMFEMFEY